MTLCPVYPETPAPPERKETLEMQGTQVSRVLQVFVASPDLMELKETKDSLDGLVHLDDKDPQVLLETPEMKAKKASVMMETQALRGSQALLDSAGQQEILLSGPQDQSDFRGLWALRGPKECPDPPAPTDYQESWVWLEVLEFRAREDRMGLLVSPALRGPRLPAVRQEHLGQWASLALRDP